MESLLLSQFIQHSHTHTYIQCIGTGYFPTATCSTFNLNYTHTHVCMPAHTSAVRNGDLVLFGEVLDKYGHQFQSEKTYTLIIRLRHNVIKTGIRIISLSYSRISLADIAHKLQLDSAEDAEYIVAKVTTDWHLTLITVQ